MAINSHVLQKNGILSSIADKGHIYVLRYDFLNPKLFFFKKSGLHVSYTFKGFCSEHDKSIFKPIEDFEFDFEDYKNQLLFAYRTVVNERRKKEVSIDCKHAQLRDSLIESIIDKSITRELIAQERLSLRDLHYYEDLIISDLYKGTTSFTFKTRYVKSVDICLASHFTFETTRHRKEVIETTGKDVELLTDIFISFFPIEDGNVLILGYEKRMESTCGEFVNNFINSEENILLKQLSNLLIGRCEEWACSESFYKKYIQPREEKLIDLFLERAGSIDEDNDIAFNLFESIN